MPREHVANEYSNPTLNTTIITEPSSSQDEGNVVNASTMSSSSNHSQVNKGRNPFESPPKPLHDSSEHTHATFLPPPEISQGNIFGAPAGTVGASQVGGPNIFDSSPRDRSAKYSNQNTDPVSHAINVSGLSHSSSHRVSSAGGHSSGSAHPLTDEANKKTFSRPPMLNVHKHFVSKNIS